MTHPTVKQLYSEIDLPIISAPMFIVSTPELVIQQCCNGIIGSMPALNARPQELLDEWLDQINKTLDQKRKENPNKNIAPYAINLIIHKSNERVEADLASCEKHKVPMIITSLGLRPELIKRVHNWGGLVFHDITTFRHAEKAIEAGVDGLIIVCNGAGGHAGQLSPFAIVPEIRKIFDGPIALSGSITNGSSVLAAQTLGADFAYIGTRFIATHEANAVDEYKQMILDSSAKDILYTPFFTGIPGNYLVPSIKAAGLDPENLEEREKDTANFGKTRKTWKDIWGAGQGVGNIDTILTTAQLVEQLKQEYQTAKKALTNFF